MKKTILLFLILSSSFLSLRAQSWLWGRVSSGGGYGDAWMDHSVSVDESGNMFYTGQFSANLTFGTHTISDAIDISAFIVKYNSTGAAQWARAATIVSSNGQALGASTAIDHAGNVYLTGSFQDSVSFGSFGLNGTNNMFLVKYDANGNVLWVRDAGLLKATSTCSGASLACDALGNIYMVGTFEDTVSLGTTTLKAQTGITFESFIAKYDPSGNLLWVKQSTGASSISVVDPWSIAVDNAGNAYITGSFRDTVSFGAYTLVDNYRNTNDFFVTKYDASGNELWAKQAVFANDSGSAGANSVTVDGDGYVYLAGAFGDTVYFDGNKVSAYGSSSEAFLAKYSPSGSVVWIKQSYDINSQYWYAGSVASDTLKGGGGYLELTGGGAITGYTLKFGADTFKLKTMGSATSILKFDSAGNVLCGSFFSVGPEDDGTSVGVDRSGQYVYLAGDLIDTTILGSDTLPPSAGEALYCGRWQPCGSLESLNQLKTLHSGVKAYPNPNSGAFTLQLSGVSSSSSIEIYNAMGKKIYSKQDSPIDSQLSINLGQLPAGIYFYRVTDIYGALIGSGKLIIE